eukprot:4307883-Amphidinium_carterae.2
MPVHNASHYGTTSVWAIFNTLHCEQKPPCDVTSVSCDARGVHFNNFETAKNKKNTEGKGMEPSEQTECQAVAASMRLGC